MWPHFGFQSDLNRSYNCLTKRRKGFMHNLEHLLCWLTLDPHSDPQESDQLITPIKKIIGSIHMCSNPRPPPPSTSRPAWPPEMLKMFLAYLEGGGSPSSIAHPTLSSGVISSSSSSFLRKYWSSDPTALSANFGEEAYQWKATDRA